MKISAEVWEMAKELGIPCDCAVSIFNEKQNEYESAYGLLATEALINRAVLFKLEGMFRNNLIN